MYLVTIKTEGKEFIINEISTRTKNRIEGTIKQGINSIDSFEFTIYPDNIGYNKITPYKTFIEVFNTKTNEHEFKGRVTLQIDEMESTGLISKTFMCESELGYLCDSVQLYGEYHNVTVASFLDFLIKQHNSLVEEEKQFEVGIVEELDNNDSLYRFLSYNTTWNNIKEDLLDKLGGEFQIRYSQGKRYLDYLIQKGKTSETIISVGRNMKSMTEDKNSSEYYTRLLPLGGKLKTTNGEGQEVETGHRMTVEEVNNGSIYIEDTEAIKEFGIRTGIQIWEDVANPENLLRKGKEYLLNQKITVTDKIDAVDLSLINLDIDSFKVGDFYTIKNELFDIKRKVRIIEKTIHIESPENTTITLGDEEEDLKKHNLSEKKQILSEIEKTIKKQSTFEQTVEGIRTEVLKSSEQIGELKTEIEQTAEEINSKVSANDVQSIVTQNAESWNLSINGKLKGTNYTFNGDNFEIGGTDDNNKAYHNNTSSKWLHSDGTYTQVDPNGLKWHHGGTNYTYNSVVYAGAVVGGRDDIWGMWVSIPEHIGVRVGSNYQVIVTMSRYSWDRSQYGDQILDQISVFVTSKQPNRFYLEPFITGTRLNTGEQVFPNSFTISYMIVA